MGKIRLQNICFYMYIERNFFLTFQTQNFYNNKHRSPHVAMGYTEMYVNDWIMDSKRVKYFPLLFR